MKWDRTVTTYELRKYMEFCHDAANLLIFFGCWTEPHVLTSWKVIKWDRTVTSYELRKYMEFCGQFHAEANLLIFSGCWTEPHVMESYEVGQNSDIV